MAYKKLKPLLVRVEQYRKGLEDGYRPHPKGMGFESIPFVNTPYGKQDVTPDDYIVEFNGGLRHVWRESFVEFATKDLTKAEMEKVLVEDEDDDGS